MNISEVRIKLLDESTKVLALCSITLYAEFVITGLKVMNGQKGLWVAMPNRKGSDNEYHDIVFPVTKEAREVIQLAVLDKYKEVYDKANTPQEQDKPFTSDTAKELHDQIHGRQGTPIIDITEDDMPFA